MVELSVQIAVLFTPSSRHFDIQYFHARPTFCHRAARGPYFVASLESAYLGRKTRATRGYRFRLSVHNER
jgi:hypothetical protein